MERDFFHGAGKHLREPSRAGLGSIFTVNRCWDERQVLHRKAERETRGVRDIVVEIKRP
jgi:hypothetical protein